jgi:hypothetical protein
LNRKSESTHLSEAIERALIAFEYNDLTGAMPINVTDALLAIAAAINRLAKAQEMMLERAEHDAISRRIAADNDRPGHA